MHNLAIALHKKGDIVTGSDDEIFEPSRSRLETYGILPGKMGWDPARIEPGIDLVILGMHARADNPELMKANELGLRVRSFPEFLYENARDKKRIVIGGSHGKTTITSMIMHVFRECGIDFDYMVGSAVEGFDTMVGLSDSSPIALFEGDEYLTSPMDRRPKFHLYKPDIAVINGISWDHINVFPDYDDYVEQFRIFTDMITENGTLLYFTDDKVVKEIAGASRADIVKVPYGIHGYFQNRKGFFGATLNRVVPLKIFGEHNMQNLSAAKEVCMLAGISEERFYGSITSFRGSARRLQLLAENGDSAFYLDFAHAPSKVRATVNAVAERYPDHRIIALFEMHTFSSLSKDFTKEYKGSLKEADRAMVYFNPHAIAMKKLEPLDPVRVKEAFGGDNITVFDDSEKLMDELFREKGGKRVYLVMSSGDFDGTDINELAGKILETK